MTTSPKICRKASLILASALASTGLVTLSSGAALAVPAGGYGDLVEAVSPSVVFIEVTAKLSQADFAQGLPEGAPEELKRHFEQMNPANPDATPMRGLGSGFIISSDGQIVTNAHVVDGAETVTVKFADGHTLMAEVIGSDPMTDIALLKVTSPDALPAVSFGASSEVRAGDEAIAVGNPFGLGGTVTSGIISATSRDIHAGPFDDFLQTDAAINQGNSGGPLFDADGKVIGVNTAILSPGGGSVGIGFAVPSDLVQEIVADLADDGKITRGWLGVQIKPMSEEIAQVLGFDAPKGAMVEAVTKDSPAAEAGLEVGDIILSFNGTAIAELRDLPRAVAALDPEAKADITLLRRGQEVTQTVTVGALGQAQT